MNRRNILAMLGLSPAIASVSARGNGPAGTDGYYTFKDYPFIGDGTDRPFYWRLWLDPDGREQQRRLHYALQSWPLAEIMHNPYHPRTPGFFASTKPQTVVKDEKGNYVFPVPPWRETSFALGGDVDALLQALLHALKMRDKITGSETRTITENNPPWPRASGLRRA